MAMPASVPSHSSRSQGQCRMFKQLICVVLLGISLASRADIDPGDKQPVPNLHWSDGQTQYSLYHIKDKPKVLHFWAAWCIPCREEMPEVIQWRKQNPDIAVLALSLDERMAQTQHFIEKFKLDMPPLLVNEDDIASLAVPVVPYTIFVSGDNRFLGSYLGVAPWLDPGFTDEVRELLHPE